MKQNINLHIERLVLDGLEVDRAQAGHVKTMIITELSRLLATHGLSPHWGRGAFEPVIRTEAIRMEDSMPRNIGTLVAHSVFGGIGNKQ